MSSDPNVWLKHGNRNVLIKGAIFDIGGTLIGPHDYLKFVGHDPEGCMNTGALQLLRYLAARGVKLGIVSNTEIAYEAVIETFARLQFRATDFVAIILSSDPLVDRGKPSKRIYKIAAKAFAQCGIRHENIVFVGDHYRNDVMRPRIKYNMNTIYLRDQDTHDKSIALAQVTKYRHATFVVGHIRDVSTLIDESG